MSESGDTRVDHLSRFLGGQDNIEAILYDPEKNRVSLAVLGNVDQEALGRALNETMRILGTEFNATITPDSLPSPTPEQMVSDISVRKLPHEILIEKNSHKSGSDQWNWREFTLEPLTDATTEEEEEDWRKQAAFAAICAGGIMAAWVSGHLGAGHFWQSVFYIVAIMAGGWDPAIETFHNLRRRKLDIHFLMLAVALGAAAIDALAEGAILLFLFSFSGALETYAMHRTRKEISDLFKTTPKRATIIAPDGREKDVPVEEVSTGHTIRVKPGDLVAVDARIIDGKTACDESNLTGESIPVDKNPGDIIYSGTLNIWGAVDAMVLRPASQSALQKIITLIRQAQKLKAPSQRFTDKFGTGYTWLVLAATTAMFFVWWLLMGLPAFRNTPEGFSAFYRAMTLLVVASPCALVLSIPSAILAAIAWGARNGILFRGGAAVEKLAQVDTLALDKTGTMTTGNMRVVAIESHPPGREREIAEMAYALENQSKHPIAHAIVQYALENKLRLPQIDGFQSITGKGLTGQVDNRKIVIGRRELLEKGPLAKSVVKIPPPGPGMTEVWLIHDRLIGCIILQDEIRRETKSVLEKIKSLGIRALMLTGDRREAALAVGQSVGLTPDQIKYGLHPEDKVREITALARSGARVAMVGDGVNDAPSLAAAYVSVAMGARGSDAALEQSEVILMKDRLDNFLNAYRLSHAARRIIHQNLFISLGTVIVMVCAALLGIVPLTVGVIAHEGSTVLVCANSLRLLFLKKD
ncbi:heavy metal translocating P-type ATPase [Kamptonema cortianum]|nr:heavy metal translocating P-type ATPase [Kamptonema cortianum]